MPEKQKEEIKLNHYLRAGILSLSLAIDMVGNKSHLFCAIGP